MASAWPEEQTFTCSICLETLKDPATLACGHSFCLVCIQGHWDFGRTKNEYSCPQCRQIFYPRPTLARSTLLMEAMEQLKLKSDERSMATCSAPPSIPVYLEVLPNNMGDGRPQQQGTLYPQLPTRTCPQHRQPLHLFCREDKEFLCDECVQYRHKGHHVLKPEEERKERQRELVQMQTNITKRLQEMEMVLREVPEACKAQKVSIQELRKEHDALHADLISDLMHTKISVDEFLSTIESSLVSHVEGRIHQLEQEKVQLQWKSRELNQMATMDDHHCFLKNFLTLEPPSQTVLGDESFLIHEAKEKVARIRTSMLELKKPLQDLCKNSVTKVLTEAAPVTTVALVNPEPKCREDMLKFFVDLTFDSNSVYHQLLLSDGGKKATLKAQSLDPADHPDRFDFWRQVLCNEPLAGSPYYWEVEWTGQKITIAVAYKEMKRKGSDNQSRLGHNERSWALYWSGTSFSFWHMNQETVIGVPKARRVGVYLDQHAGYLAFYRISKCDTQLIYKHQTQFTGPLYPGFRFWAGVGATVTICPSDMVL